MPRTLLVLLLVGGLCVSGGDGQMRRDDAAVPPDGPGADAGAFFALRSCHRLLGADRGEFFSPDYLCSNPPLWCNWTIQVDPGQRIHLHLEDFTPDDSCHLKQDQIHVDEPAGPSAGHRILQRCWREAKYTSSSNSLQVVLLIGGWPSPTYRGFYGRYQAFGPPVAYDPQRGVRERLLESDVTPEPSDLTRGSTDELPLEAVDAEVWDSPVDPLTAAPTGPASTHGTSRSGRGAALNRSDMNESPQQRRDTSHELRPDVYGPTAQQEAADGSEPAAGNRTEPARPSTAELLSDPRGRPTVRNHSVTPQLPGDLLFEVAVEVDFKPHPEDSWENQARSLLLSIKALVREALEAELLHVSAKRIKRLKAGALFILWLRVGPGPGPGGSLQGLVGAGLGDEQGPAGVVSVSTADVNECGTQLVLCDANADCVNHFGSYSCHCRPGFRDESRLGSGGTVCVDVRGCSSGLSPEAKGVFALFFLLGASILTLLLAAAVLYRRHHRGAFALHRRHDGGCSCPAEDLPPPPPARGPAPAWPQGKQRRPAADLPLLRFSPRRLSDGAAETRESGRM